MAVRAATADDNDRHVGRLLEECQQTQNLNHFYFRLRVQATVKDGVQCSPFDHQGVSDVVSQTVDAMDLYKDLGMVASLHIVCASSTRRNRRRLQFIPPSIITEIMAGGVCRFCGKDDFDQRRHLETASSSESSSRHLRATEEQETRRELSTVIDDQKLYLLEADVAYEVSAALVSAYGGDPASCFGQGKFEVVANLIPSAADDAGSVCGNV